MTVSLNLVAAIIVQSISTSGILTMERALLPNSVSTTLQSRIVDQATIRFFGVLLTVGLKGSQDSVYINAATLRTQMCKNWR